MTNEQKITAYKGFDENFKCRGFQYEVGKTYHHVGKVKACKSGFHACTNPFDVWNYYSPASSKFATVTMNDVDTEGSGDSKVASATITIEKELSLHNFVKEGVESILSEAEDYNTNTGYYSAATNTGDKSAATNTGDKSAATNTGNYSAATNTGYYSAATNTGYYSAATNTGYCSVATNTGYYSAATNTGDKSAATNTGNYSAATNTGYYSAATNTGDKSAATNTGNYSAATNTGDKSVATVEGESSVAIATGHKSKAKAPTGSALVICERDDNMNLINIYSAIVGKDNYIKPDTFYMLIDGVPVECVNDE